MQRTFREIMFLQELTTHDNIIKYALIFNPTHTYTVAPVSWKQRLTEAGHMGLCSVRPDKHSLPIATSQAQLCAMEA